MPGAATVGVEAAASVRAALRAAEAKLEAAGCATPRLDAELLAADALGLDRAALYAHADRALPGSIAEAIAACVGRRAEREPVAYITGRRAFRHLELEVDARVLIPRPETELLVEVALAEVPPGGRVHDVGTGSGAIALALKHERPDLVVSASDLAGGAVALAQANAARLGLGVAVGAARGLPSGELDLVVANLPYVRDAEWLALEPEVRRYEPRDALLGGGEDGLDAIRELVASAPMATRLALEHAPAQAAAVRSLLDEAESRRGLGGNEDVTLGRAPVTDEDVATFRRCIAVGGVALFPTDTVYGLATEPESKEGVRRLYRLKDRPPDQPAAVMFFALDLALAALPELGPRTRGALERLLPGAFTLLLPNPLRRYPLACGPEPERLGLRVPVLEGALAPLGAAPWPVLQSSANRAGGPEARRIEEVDERVRRGVDQALDGGELGGVASTVVDLTSYEAEGRHRVVREGAVRSARVAELL